MNVGGSNYKPGNIYVPKYRNWVFEMEKGTTIMFRPELMKAMMVGTAKTFEKEFTAGIIHLNPHVKERTMHNEFDHVVDRIYPIKRANNTMKIFRKNYPVWSKHLQHGLFPDRSTDTIYEQPGSEFELTVVDSLMAQQRERERIFNKDAQSAKVTIPETSNTTSHNNQWGSGQMKTLTALKRSFKRKTSHLKNGQMMSSQQFTKVTIARELHLKHFKTQRRTSKGTLHRSPLNMNE